MSHTINPGFPSEKKTKPKPEQIYGLFVQVFWKRKVNKQAACEAGKLLNTSLRPTSLQQLQTGLSNPQHPVLCTSRDNSDLLEATERIGAEKTTDLPTQNCTVIVFFFFPAFKQKAAKPQSRAHTCEQSLADDGLITPSHSPRSR